jgi:hypothetical protein
MIQRLMNGKQADELVKVVEDLLPPYTTFVYSIIIAANITQHFLFTNYFCDFFLKSVLIFEYFCKKLFHLTNEPT